MKTIVIKLGGSVLVDDNSYRAYGCLLRDRLSAEPGSRFVVVVSARFGETDALLASARSMSSAVDAPTLDLLWSTGEIKSAALLALALQEAGVRASALDVHQTGIRRVRDLDIDAAALRRALRRCDVVVIPGFLASGRGGAVVSLGRGGSDLTAVAVAAALNADCCELMKDVPGYFTADPHHVADAAHIPEIDYERALEMARDGCDLVQAAALENAQRAYLKLVIRAADDPRITTVAARVNRSRRNARSAPNDDTQIFDGDRAQRATC